MSTTTVATANVLCDLSRTEAAEALDGVLAAGPDLVGLQEWSALRLGVLRRRGRVTTVPSGPSGRGTTGRGGWVWSAPLLGGCVVGADSARYDLLRARPVVLSRPGRADRGGRLGLEPGRVATVGVYADRRTARTVALVSYHLVSGVQQHDAPRADRPLLVARHDHETACLQQLVDRLLAAGHVVHAVGDANRHGFTLAGLTSAWDGRPDHLGTLGPRRRVDDAFGPGPATDVTLLTSASDHRAVVVRRPDRPHG